jgi:Leucine-rich repeat (LRR) protein
MPILKSKSDDDPDKNGQSPDGDKFPGFQTPDAVLDAYVKALRDGDVAACKATMTRQRLKNDETYLSTRVKEPVTPEALDKELLGLMKFYNAVEWKEGEYKRFPAEIDSDNKGADIICVYQNNAKGMKDRYRKYVFLKTKDGWLQTDWMDGDAKDLNPKQYAYAWDKPKPPDTGFPLDDETKKAIAGVKLKPLDVKVRGAEFTMLAPEGAKVAEDNLEGGFLIQQGDNFKMKIQFGKPNFKLALEGWKKRTADLGDRFGGVVVQRDNLVVYKTVRKIVEDQTMVHFAATVTLGHVDVTFHESALPGSFTLSQCLLMLHCARTAALKPDYKPVTSLADLERLGFRLNKDDVSGKIVSIDYGELSCTDATLALLVKYAPDQEYLYLPREITDDGLKPVASLKHLKELSLSPRRDEGFMDGSGLVYLKGLTTLEHLELPSSDVTDDMLVHFKELTKLQSLDLGDTKVTGTGFQHLKGLTQLTALYLQGCPVTDDGLKQVQGLTSLVNLTLSETKITDAGLQYLKGMKQLVGLNFAYTEINGSGFVHLAGLTEVQSIYLPGTKTTDEHFKHFAGMKKLNSLFLDSTPVTGIGLAPLKDLPLSSLSLNNTKVNDEGLKAIGQLANLSNLHLDQTAITDVGLQHLQGLTKLQSLNLNGTKIDGSGFQHFKMMTDLQSIAVGKTQFNDDGVKHLSALKNVKSLFADETPISDAGLAHLKNNGELEALYLHMTKITDAGLVHLKSLKKLRALYAGKTGVTEKGIADLQKSLPELKETNVGM